MTHDELYTIKQTVKKADNMINTISKVKSTLKSLDSIGKCTEIEFNYYGYPETAGYGVDTDAKDYYYKTINHESLGITKEAFAEWFTDAHKQLLRQLQSKIEQELKDLQLP